MRNTIALIAVFISICVTSCGPNRSNYYKDDFVSIKGRFNDTNRVIALGDTLKISLQLPDSMQTTLGVVPIQSVQKAFFAMSPRIVDTINKTYNLVNHSNYWTDAGPSNGFFYFNTTTKPYRSVIYFKPPQKGIYYIEVAPQPGDMKLNNQKQYVGLLVDFDVTNRHLDIVAPHTTDGQGWLNAVANHNARGFGSYAFRVN